ncbi:MAG: universal stress protein [Chloroflexi bacterium]|nr:universal stress protein [Chloroflexota bacterium]
MFRAILVPLDGSPIAEQSLPTAARIARATGAALHLIHVHVEANPNPIFINGMPVVDTELHSLAAEHERVYLERAAASVAGDGLQPIVTQLTGPVVKTITSYARDIHAGLIVLTTHGRSGFDRLWLGSVAEALARVATTPLLLLRPGEAQHVAIPTFRQVLVPLDGSERAAEAIALAVALARIDDGQVTLLRVVDTLPVPELLPFHERFHRDEAVVAQEEATATRYLQGLVGTSAPPGTQTLVLRADQPARAILEVARERAVDLVVMATQGHGAARGVTLSRVTDKVLRGIGGPLLVMRPGQQQSD